MGDVVSHMVRVALMAEDVLHDGGAGSVHHVLGDLDDEEEEKGHAQDEALEGLAGDDIGREVSGEQRRVLGGDVAGFTVDDSGGIVDVDVARRHGE